MELYETLVYGGAKGRGWVPEEQRFYHDEVIVQTSRPSNYWREWLGLQSNGGFDADRTNLALGALGNSLGVQGGILDYGVRTNFKSARTISEFNKLRPTQQAWRQMATYGKTGQAYMKGLNAFGKGLGYAQGAVIIADVYTNSQIKASNVLDGIVTGVSFVPGWGWIAGGIYYGADLMTRGITGQSIGQHLDNAVGGPLVVW
jgi:hypothetical protein